MTEEEKRRIAAFIAAERQRPAPTSIFDNHTAIEHHLAKTAKRRAIMGRLSQRGITWDDLKATYDA